jgi:hypothetical protein
MILQNVAINLVRKLYINLIDFWLIKDVYRYIVGSGSSRVKQKTIQLAFVASPLSSQH